MMTMTEQVTEKFLIFAVLFLLISFANATYAYSVFEKLDVPETWRKEHSLEPKVLIPVKIALRERNLEKAEDFIMDIAFVIDNASAYIGMQHSSDPKSSHYGDFWSLEKVFNTFAPSDETIDAVRDWLVSAGIAIERITLSEDRTWLHFDTYAKEAEELFRAKYYYFSHERGERAIASETYSIPDSLKDHIDFVKPGATLSVTLKNGGHPEPFIHHKRPALKYRECKVTNLTCCDILVHPGCIRALYQLPDRPDSHEHSLQKHNHLGIYEATSKDKQKDLNLFFKRYASFIPQDTYPKIRALGPVKGYDSPDGETALDLDCAYPIVYPQIIETLQGEDLLSNLFNRSQNPPYVISTSFYENFEHGPKSKKHFERGCNGYMKLALMGSSVIVSSGDEGVGFSAKKPFTSQIPAVCPFVTSVGGTEIKSGNSVHHNEIAVRGSGLHYTSGGGFSQLFKSPSYQKEAIAEYFKNHDPNIPYYNGTKEYPMGKQKNGPKYNRLGRGLPDVAANGKNIAVALGKHYTKEGGTSASAPIFAAIINIIIEERMKAGKKPLGFLNPAIYQNPAMFNDIHAGFNSGAGYKKAFKAVKGWDPVTGFGTPNYPKMLAYFMSLP